VDREAVVNTIRKFQTIFSVLIFILITALCWAVTGFKITEIQLSYWSKIEGISYFWNGALILIGISTWINQWMWLENYSRMPIKSVPKILCSIVSACLILTGAFNMDWEFLHNLFAFSYFLGYPLVIFVIAYLNRAHIKWSHWIQMILISTSMIIFPLVLIPIWKGMAPSEIVHSALVIWWNLWILKTR
jgi:hypothetical protein